MREIILLGPQASKPRVKDALNRLGIKGQVCCITAGWQERAGELDALRDHVQHPLVNLELYFRAENVFAKDPEFAAAHRRRQDFIKDLQETYRVRLGYYVEAGRQILRYSDNPALAEPEIEGAIEVVRSLDRHHAARIREVHCAFEEEWNPLSLPSILRHREELGNLIADCQAVLVAGGHVATLLNRLRLFGISPLLGDRPIIAWSAGAMVLSKRVVLFHDSPPQGAGAAEVFEEGLQFFDKILPLPHARHRLLLDDRLRVRIFALRFAPQDCVALDAGSLVHWDGTSWHADPGTWVLRSSGAVEEYLAA